MSEYKEKKTGTLSLKRNKDHAEPQVNPAATETESVIAEYQAEFDKAERFSDKASSEVAASSSKANDAEKIKTLESILNQLFIPVTNKDGKVRASALTQALQSDLKRIQQPGRILNEVLKKLVASVGVTDPEFNKLSQVVILTQSNHEVSKVVLDFAVKALSEHWVGKHLGYSNLFLSEAEPLSLSNPGILAHLTRSFSERYEARITSIKEQLKQKEGSDSSSSLRSLTPEHLRQQCENLLTICYLWAVETGKCDVKIGIQAFENRIVERGDGTINEKKVCGYLASQLSESRSGIADTIRYYEALLNGARDRQRGAEAINEQLRINLHKIDVEKMQLAQQVCTLQQEIELLKVSLNQVKTQSEEQVLDDKALRVHLKDDVSKTKSRAFNLLNEDVMEPLKLSLNALQRENPKVEIATHYVELVLESIERELSWFRK
ncbi:TPA: hypothetical protein N5L24_001169 [Enterobacter roggenkampii]|uniref:hypothetical protein n=1 Tax=Enterobacter roggenkampii TaxID=1812935 RepID=UPI002002BE68|nr:hypothetical protein [Enterobacter roggenkampii]MCK7179029.1 hypothetical protein [Enterobacter roggenkampii]HCM9211033.1 hypothetical protein [Enterobacter roggenkampii]